MKPFCPMYSYKLTTMAHNENITLEKKEVIRNLYLSGIGEEFIAMQLDIEIPDVIKVLKELDVYKSPA
jgi:hypothetical protein